MSSSSSFYQKPSAPSSQVKQYTVGSPDENQPFSVSPDGFLNNQTPRELSPEERQELARFRSTANQPGKLTDYAKKRAEILANIGRNTKDIAAEGVVFSLKTLKTKETREATLPMFKCQNDIDAGFEIRRQTLARSIFAIDGQEISLIVGGDDLELRLELIDELEESLISTLYKAHLDLKQETLDKFFPKNEIETKGVLEDLKK